jgi:hypothetical protein
VIEKMGVVDPGPVKIEAEAGRAGVFGAAPANVDTVISVELGIDAVGSGTSSMPEMPLTLGTGMSPPVDGYERVAVAIGTVGPDVGDIEPDPPPQPVSATDAAANGSARQSGASLLLNFIAG